MKETKKPKYNMWQNSIYMIKLAWKECKLVLVHIPLIIAIALLNNLAEVLVVPVILQKIETHSPLTDLLFSIGGFSLALILFSALQTYMRTISESPRTLVRMRIINALNNKRYTMSYPYMEDTKVGKLFSDAGVSCASNWAAAEGIWTTITELLKAIFGFLIYILLLSALDIRLLLLVIITNVISYFSSKYINEWEYRNREEKASYTKQCSYVSARSEDRTLAKDVRIFGMQSWLNDLHTNGLSLLYGFMERREKHFILAKAIETLLAFLRNGLAYGYLIIQVLSSDMSAAEFLLYFSAIGEFTNWVTAILTQVQTLHKESLELNVIREFLELPEYFKFEEGESLTPDNETNYEITLKNVTFHYPESDHAIFENLNLTIHSGEKLAIVGLNGAGKTTLVKLICGFYDPTEGEVLLNGKNIKDFNRYDYYKHFTAVFQQFSVLETSVEANVAQSVTNIDAEKVADCLEKAGLTGKIASLPNGLQTNVGRWVFEDGVEFSGGETQRLMLARALYKNAPILVLDEPTAALDPIAENDIYQKYSQMTEGRTSLFISHRLASTRFCDRIIFLADGNIKEEGTHDSLIALGGDYAELFSVQSKYYQEGGELHE